MQANFAGPVGQWYAPDDSDKPDAFIISTSAAGESLAVHTVPMYEDRQDEDSLPPYEWARLSNLPSPVVIGDSWPSLLAAQREKSRLLDTQDTSRPASPKSTGRSRRSWTQSWRGTPSFIHGTAAPRWRALCFPWACPTSAGISGGQVGCLKNGST